MAVSLCPAPDYERGIPGNDRGAKRNGGTYALSYVQNLSESTEFIYVPLSAVEQSRRVYWLTLSSIGGQ